MKSLKYFAALICALVTLSCGKTNKNEPKSEPNTLVETEWANEDGSWVVAFEKADKGSLTRKINMGARGPVTVGPYSFRYKLDGATITIQEDKAVDAPYGKMRMIHNFKGTLSGNTIDATVTYDWVETATAGKPTIVPKENQPLKLIKKTK